MYSLYVKLFRYDEYLTCKSLYLQYISISPSCAPTHQVTCLEYVLPLLYYFKTEIVFSVMSFRLVAALQMQAQVILF